MSFHRYLPALVLVAFCAAWSGTADAKLPPAPAGFKIKGDLKKGKKIYKKYCKKCHGKRGNGKGLMSKDLKPKPRDFTRPDMKKKSDWELFVGIRDGGKPAGLSDKMTAWKDTLTTQEIHDVIVYIRAFAKK